MAKKNIKGEKRISNVPVNDNKEKASDVLIYFKGMTVADVAKGLNVAPAKIIGILMKAGIMATQNHTLEKEKVEEIALDFDFLVEDEVVTDVARFDEFELVDDEKDLTSRPAVVTIMGHVDHGKTTLLDMIRNTRVVENEAGGITQHIGAYQVQRKGHAITFLDTPGHAAFTKMRARGAGVTDIVILVVAADDGVMPQTEEAIAHAQAAKCPIIVAVNKMDKPGVNPDKVMEELSRYNLLPEAWGGNTPFVKISALKNMGIEELLDMIQLYAEMEDLKANPNRLASGTVIEASLDKGRGPLATLIVQNGTLKIGDFLVCGQTYGKIRTMEDDRKVKFDEALPSTAVMVTGLSSVPLAGDRFMVFENEKMAKEVAEQRTHISKELQNQGPKTLSLDELFSANSGKKELNVVIKGDTQGCVEAIKGAIEKLSNEEVNTNILRAGVGTITDSDVTLAQASNAIIIGFNVRPMANVRRSADDLGVEIRLYSIIYRIIEDIEQALTGMLDPKFEEVVTGQAEVRDTFKLSSVGTIAGCYVTDGSVMRNSIVRIMREGIVIFEGKMASLKRFKDDAKEVKKGFECGITIEGFNDIKNGDVFETSVMKEVKRK